MAIFAALACTVLARTSHAQPSPQTLESAADAYDRGVAAHASGDFDAAAAAFGEADALVPSDGALEAALEACEKAQDALACMRLAARGERRESPKITGHVSNVRARFGSRVGQVRVSCSPAPCDAKIDGAPVPLKQLTMVTSGAHSVVIVRDGSEEERRVEVPGGNIVDVAFIAQAAPTVTTTPTVAPAEPPSRTGLSPVWSFAGILLTAAAGGATALSWLDTVSTHDEFDAKRCSIATNDDCEALAADGRDGLTRTNVLLGVTVVAAAVTVVVSAFAVDWRGRPRARVRAGGAGMSFTF